MSLRDTEQLSQMVLNTLHAKAVCIVANLGIADQIPLGASKSATDIAKSTGCHAPSLYRMLRLLASHGVFNETSEGTFEHTSLSVALRADAEGAFHAGAKLFHPVVELFNQLHHTVRPGGSGLVKIFGPSMFEYLQRQPEL